MSNMMAVLINEVAQLEYDRDKPLTDYQNTYLEKMDRQMDEEGIQIDSEVIRNPELNQKIQFVAGNMLSAMKVDNAGMTSALCTYLATRLPDLKQVKITEKDNEATIDLVFDEEYKGQVAVSFTSH